MPATITALIGLGVYRAQKAIDVKRIENDALEQLRRDAADQLKSFFEGLYQKVMVLPTDDEFRSTMQRELADKRILFCLPRTALNRLMAALRTADRVQVVRELVAAFPDNKEAILAPLDKR